VSHDRRDHAAARASHFRRSIGTRGSSVARIVGGRYRLDEQLGSGGFGTVWRAWDQLLHVDVAVKQVHLDPSATDVTRMKAVARAEAEARSAAKLRDQVLLRIDGTTDPEGCPSQAATWAAGDVAHIVPSTLDTPGFVLCLRPE
jgi:serine/threonine protein kinase